MSQRSFGYRAERGSGGEFVGTLNAENEQSARSVLESLNLRIKELWAAGGPVGGGPLTAAEFKAFNEQIEMLVKAGLPLETGLELLAAGKRRRKGDIISEVHADLQSGMTLAQAAEKHANRFPPDYAMLLDAAIKTNTLSPVLLSLSHHLEMKRKLRESLFNAFGYPAFVLAAMILVGAIFSWYVLPLFARFTGYWTHEHGSHPLTARPPWPTAVLLFLGYHATFIVCVIAAAVLCCFGFWVLFRRRPVMANIRDWIAAHVPVLGPAVRAALIARWCDGLRIGVVSGMDLPQAVELACAVTGSPMISACGSNMNFAMERGLPIDKVVAESALPPAIGTAIQSGVAGNNLAETLTVLSEGYTKEAETRIAMLPAILTPALLVLLSFIVLFTFWGLTAPFLKLLRELTG